MGDRFELEDELPTVVGAWLPPRSLLLDAPSRPAQEPPELVLVRQLRLHWVLSPSTPQILGWGLATLILMMSLWLSCLAGLLAAATYLG